MSAPEGSAEEGGQTPGPARVYLKSVSVEGFRGIGPKETLYVTPGPGLTVVTGRNGSGKSGKSGKSSFAEAAELALTGENKRWADRSSVWKEGWRNLHEPASAPRLRTRSGLLLALWPTPLAVGWCCDSPHQ